jgi:hypothetical protein
MQRYANLSGSSSVRWYETSSDAIRVGFQDGKSYTYTAQSAGLANVQQMHSLAHAGRGLGGFINRYVKYKYAAKHP